MRISFEIQGDILGKKGQGYVFQLAGVAGVVGGKPGPLLACGAGGEMHHVQLYRQRVCHQSANAFDEIRWDPEDEVTVSIHGLKFDGFGRDAKMLGQGLALLEGLFRAGRSGTFEDAETFRVVFGTAV